VTVSEDDLDDLLGLLVATGAVELMSVDDRGEPIYRLTDRCRELLPELYEEHTRTVQELVHSLWLHDLVEVSFDDEGYQVASVHDYNYRRYLEVIDSLTDEQVRLVNTLVDLQDRGGA
jgi:hypothetical protein